LNNPAAQPRRLGVLRAIAVFKFCKSAFVIATGFGLLSFYNPVVSGVLFRLARDLPYAFEQRFVRQMIAFLSGLSPHRIQIIAIATFCYSGLFLVEGVGLWKGLYWAEVLTIIATSSLIPVEVYEIHAHYTHAKVLVLVANLVIVGYLVWRLRREQALHQKMASPGAAD
jgi:uncharacterized membrane protein (DUF2068 family)